ncbi:16S rRNA (cytidine(1402)-2'-O)-methyltransferase [Candidatus Gracilibacteria bacterium]|nr:16S rRNA (cytidine(1402)-2'-O)-methyltransferase [Candidatus Gracilibacteria bacterium]
MSIPSSGILSIVSTPIGNLEDITLRALRTLKEADYIACEDTRVTGQLLMHYQIENNGRLLSFHSHSGFSKLDKIIELLKEGKQIALVSDAGTPGISDPGFVLIRKAIEEGIEVTPIPGASAVLSALVASGIDCHQYLYLGFLPVKKGRQTMLKSLVGKAYTIVVYESVHRIEKTLSELEEYLGSEHHIVVGREITKKFEEFCRGTISEVREYYKGVGKVKGEFVIVL